jgi:hypothetical protein
LIGRTCKRSNALSEAGTNGRGLDLVHATSTLLDRVRKAAHRCRRHDDSTLPRFDPPPGSVPVGGGRQLKIYPGDASGEAPPVPIPNTEVKLSSAEDTRGATPWENRSSPGYFIFLQPRGPSTAGLLLCSERGSCLPVARARGRSPFGGRRRGRRASLSR